MNEILDGVLSFSPNSDEDYYAILGCDELSSKEQIIAEYKARVLGCHPDKHQGDSEKAKEFERIQTAKDVLTDDKRRQSYDKWRRSGIAIPFSKWCGMKDAVHTSMHWASPKKETMLEGGNSTSEAEQETGYVEIKGQHEAGDLGFLRTGRPTSEELEDSHPVWRRDPPSEMLRKFRNYEI